MDRTSIDPKTIKVGDWIRFYSGGRPIIGVVQYLPYSSPYSWRVDTDVAGGVLIDNIIELRSL